ncbi:streptamidine-related RiPP repeat protein [Dactylosporangium sp. CA-092794]|uniref:streptamidine-related RiPP repeat protein n=1 Tax=Dactylosporangium sp. CA-092794 TaxID=3239929 RepID=UPI003D925820
MKVTFEPVREPAPLRALQGPGTNALVHTPFTFETVKEQAPLRALQGPGTNALVHSPFTYSG